MEDLKKRNWLFTYIGANQDALAVAKGMGIDNSMNFCSDMEGTKNMFTKERRSRKAFYDKLGKGISFSLAKDEQFFVDDEGESEDSQS